MSPRRLDLDAGKPRTVCVDFDAVLHTYTHWTGPDATGRPVDGAADGLRLLRQIGARVEIFTTRPEKNTREWLDRHGLSECVSQVRDGKPYYVAFFDDRAYNVAPNRPHGLGDAVRAWLR